MIRAGHSHFHILLSFVTIISAAGTQDCVTVVSGGDDQAIRVAVFQCCTSAPTTAVDGLPTSCMQLTLLSNCHIVSAHTSAIRVSMTKLKGKQAWEMHALHAKPYCMQGQTCGVWRK